MLENVPKVSAMAVEARKTMKMPTEEDLYRTLFQLQQSNPWLLQGLISDVDWATDQFQDRLLGYLPEEDIRRLRNCLIWTGLCVLDLVDRSFFDANMQEKWNRGMVTTEP